MQQKLTRKETVIVFDTQCYILNKKIFEGIKKNKKNGDLEIKFIGKKG